MRSDCGPRAGVTTATVMTSTACRGRWHDDGDGEGDDDSDDSGGRRAQIAATTPQTIAATDGADSDGDRASAGAADGLSAARTRAAPADCVAPLRHVNLTSFYFVVIDTHTLQNLAGLWAWVLSGADNVLKGICAMC